MTKHDACLGEINEHACVRSAHPGAASRVCTITQRGDSCAIMKLPR